MITENDDISDHTPFACLLKNHEFNSLSLDEKIKICIKNNIFELNNQNFTVEDLNNTSFINNGYFGEKENDFGFASSYESICGKYSCSPDHDFLEDMKESFFDAFNLEYSKNNNNILIELDLVNLKGKKKIIKKYIKKIITSDFNHLEWRYSYSEKQVFLIQPQGTAYLINDCYNFIVNILTSESYYPTIDIKDKVMEYQNEIFNFTKLQWLMYHLRSIKEYKSIEIKENVNITQKDNDFSLLQIAVIFNKLGFYEKIQSKGIKSPLNFISKLIGKNASRYRHANAKYSKYDKIDGDLSPDELSSVREVLKLIKEDF